MKQISKLTSVLTTAAGLALARTTSAVSYFDPSGTLGLGSADLIDTVLNIVNWLLGLLGIIAVIMILWAGFKWMTAGGDTSKAADAKKILYAAVIGLVIILLAWAIVAFTTGTLENVSGVQ